MRAAATPLLLAALSCAAGGGGAGAAGGAACGGVERGAATGGRGGAGAGAPGVDGPTLLPQVTVDGAALRADAFAADAALLFPEAALELRRGLLRAELARREAARLGLEADEAEVEASLVELRAAVLAERAEAAPSTAAPPPDDDVELAAWARERYGRGWPEVRAAFAAHLRANQRYQLAVRADGWRSGRLHLQWFVCADEAEADAVLQRLRLGADPAVVLQDTLQPQAPPGGEPCAAYLPEPFGALLAAAVPGAVVGPARFDGDRSWRVARLVAREAPQEPPGRAALLADLRAAPLGAVEARAWFEEMCRRYTAEAGPLPVSSPAPAFEPLRRP